LLTPHPQLPLTRVLLLSFANSCHRFLRCRLSSDSVTPCKSKSLDLVRLDYLYKAIAATVQDVERSLGL
jgi:hypothetical protein